MTEEITSSELKEVKQKYLGKNGELTKLLKNIKNISPEKRPQLGKEVNNLKTYIENDLEKISTDLESTESSKDIDVTAPFDINTLPENRPRLLSEPGHINPLNSELKKILRIFESMGFNVQDSRQLDNDYNMFESLNFPEGHPARDMWDTFWTEEGFIPATHTSTMQNRILKNNEFPIRYVIPGTCYRNEATDASHEHTLAQIEGIYVDKDISISNMIGIIKAFLEEYYEMELKAKIQPAYFPFVEPGMEFCISCPFCQQSGCSTCGHKGWIEIFPCGMIHPNVLKEAGIDHKKYSGFAWGFGLDRLIMLKTAVHDVRRFRSGDLRFLNQF